MWFVLTAAHAGSLHDATSLYALGSSTCATRTDGPDVCWSLGDARVRTPEWPEIPGELQALQAVGEVVSSMRTLRQSWCAAYADGTVRCIGESWRRRWGMPPGTPTDEPVRVPGLSDIVALGGPCALRSDGDLLCASPLGHRKLEGLPPLKRLFPPLCGQALDGTTWCWVEGEPRSILPEVLDASLPYADGRVGAIRRLDGQVVHWVDGPAAQVELRAPPTRATTGSLVHQRHEVCALVPGGRVACRDEHGPRVGQGPKGELLFLGPPEPAPSLQCSIQDGRVHCPDDFFPPTCARPDLPADRIAERSDGLDRVLCALHQRTLRCMGAGDTELDPPPLDEVDDVRIGERIAALRPDGIWAVGDPATAEPGWTRVLEGRFEVLGARKNLVCGRTGGVWSCDGWGRLATTTLELDQDLCTAQGCLDTTPRSERPHVRLVELAP